MKYFTIVALCLASGVSARMVRRADFTKQNGLDAIALNKKFATLNANSPCQAGENACVGSAFAQCVNGKFKTTPCPDSEICAALPLVNSAGTSVTCTTQADLNARIQATGAQGGGGSSTAASPTGANNAAAGGQGSAAKTKTAASGGDPQKSLTLDPSVIAKGFEQDGQGNQAEPGQVRSLTSSNNFINFCVGQTLTNGKQIKGGSCNPAPIGSIPSIDNMPSSKFVSPKNLDTIKAGQSFNIQMKIENMDTGNFVNAQENYFAAPQQLKNGQIVGHSHIVIEQIQSLTQTTPTDPKKFAFFQGLNAPAKGGVLTANVSKGLPAGTYRMASINTAANHQPCIVPVAQHGFLDDAVYFTVADNGKAAAGGASNSGGGAKAGKKSGGNQ